MSARKSRFKLVANIPARRKQVADISKEGAVKNAELSESPGFNKVDDIFLAETKELKKENSEKKVEEVNLAKVPSVASKKSTFKLPELNTLDCKKEENASLIKTEKSDKRDHHISSPQIVNVTEGVSSLNTPIATINENKIGLECKVEDISSSGTKKLNEGCDASKEIAQVAKETSVVSPPIKSIASEKAVFRRVRPTVCLPLKKQKPRIIEAIERVTSTPVTIVADETLVKLTPAANDITLEDSGKENALPNQEIKPAEMVSNEVRPGTPVVQVPPSSPIKSPARARFAPHTPVLENSFRRQGVYPSSASESEDERRMSTGGVYNSRTRKASETVVNVPKTSAAAPALPPPESDFDIARITLMAKHKKNKTSQYVRRIAEARRDFMKKFDNKKPDIKALKMFDVIFYNPSSNPINRITPSSPRIRSERNSISSEVEKEVEQEKVDDVEKEDDPAEKSDGDDELKMPVPQVKIGLNGEIILDEKSLVIETTEAKKGREALLNSVPVFEEANKKTSYYRRKNYKGKEWTPLETKLFYKALNSLGTDFALLQELFPGRTRAELKNKYKREERVNLPLIDSALGQPSSFNIKNLRETFERERKLMEEATKRQLEETKRLMKEKKEMKYLKRNQLANRESSHENKSLSFLEQFARNSSLPNPVKQRPKRRMMRRVLHDDFIDPCDVDDDGKIRHPRKKPKEVMVYSPVQEFQDDPPANDSSDSEDLPETAEPITDAEFINLLNRNMINLQQSTIKLQLPAKGDRVRIILEDVSQDSEVGHSRHLAPVEAAGYSSLRGRGGKPEQIANSCNQTDRSKWLNIAVGRTEEVATSELLSTTCNVPSSDLCDSDVCQNEDTSKMEVTDCETEIESGYSSPIKVCENSLEDDNNRVKLSNGIAENSLMEHPNVRETADHDYFSLPRTEREVSIISSMEKNNLATLSNSKIVYTFQPKESVATSMCTDTLQTNEDDVIETDNFPDEAIATSANDSMDIEEDAIEEVPSGYEDDETWVDDSKSEIPEEIDLTEENEEAVRPRVEYRSAGNFQYAVINGSGADSRMYLTNLKKGSFVFMATEISNDPTKQQCRMYMIAESLNDQGVPELRPMPVVMPPELMAMITQDFK